MKRPDILALLLLAFATCTWGGNIVIGRAVRGDLPPLGLSFWRWAVAFGVLILFTLPLMKRSWPILKREWKLLLAMSVLAMALFHPLQYFSVQSTTAINATLLLSTCPAFVVLFSRLFLKTPIQLSQGLGIMLAFAGVAVVISKADPALLASLSFTTGDVWMLGASIVWALYSITLKFKPDDLNGYALLTATAGLGAFLLLPFYIWESHTVMPMPLSMQAAMSVGYVSLVASLLAYLAFNQGVALIGPAKAGIMLNLVPMWVTILAILFLGERLELYHLYGLALIGLGIFFNNMPSRTPKTESPQ